MSTRTATVRLDGNPTGTLSEADKQIIFQYDRNWLTNPNAVPISFTLPLREEPYITDRLHPFFENLLPEGWLLELSTKKLKISKDDEFGLLLATCADCIGAVEVIRKNAEANP